METPHNNLKNIRKVLKYCFIFMIFVSYLTFLNRVGKLNLFFTQKDFRNIQYDAGYAWIADINDPKIAIGYNLPVTLYENDLKILRDPKATTESVREQGGGKFVIWDNGTICFSTSDNSNPTQNGRTYRVEYPRIVEKRTVRIIFAFTFLLGFLWIGFSLPGKRKKFDLRSTILGKNRKLFLFSLLALIPFLYFAIKFLLPQPLWGDELFTLKNYVYAKDWYYPATFYDYPNNHVFFSLIISLYSKFIKIRTFCDAVQSPWKIRLLLIFLSIITIFFTTLSARKINKSAGVIASILLSTSLPFFLWTTQIRGYGLSMTLMSILIYLLMRVQTSPNRISFVSIAIVSALFVYIMPTNAVYIIAMGFYFLFKLLIDLGKYKESGENGIIYRIKRNPEAKILYSFLWGAVFSIMLYYPILDQMMHVYLPESGEKVVMSRELFFRIFRLGTVEIIRSSLVGQPLLSACILIGFFLFLRNPGENKSLSRMVFGTGLCLLIIPDLFFFLLGSVPYARNSLAILPVIILIFASLIAPIPDALSDPRLKNGFFLVLLISSGAFFSDHLVRLSKEPLSYRNNSLNNLTEPFFLGDHLKFNEVLTELKAKNAAGLPVLLKSPAPYFIESICDCYQRVCYGDGSGEGQTLLKNHAPYLLIQTDWKEFSANSEKYPDLSRCTTINQENRTSFKVFLCNP